MHVISLLNQKGGSGKTTSAVSLADVWARDDHDVLAVDIDPQGSLSSWLSNAGPECFEYLTGNVPMTQCLTATKWNIDLLPADRSLGSIETKDKGNKQEIYQRLQNLLAAAEEAYDFCVIDPPPSTGFLVLMSVRVSDKVISPIQPGQSAVKSFGQTMQLIQEQGRTDNENLEGGFLCQMDLRTKIDQQAPEILKETFRDKILDTFIRRTVSVREAEAAGEPLLAYAPDSTAAEDYVSLAHEIKTRL